MQVLDDLGDKSDQETRQEYFEHIDVDGSRAIDFEEFLGVSIVREV
jgi:Ca2+-binding EF-hand superfamily protein